MRRGETLIDTFTIESPIENPRAVQVTYRQGNCIILQKQFEDLVYEILENEDNEPYATQIICSLSQEETFKFYACDDALVQVRIITEDGDSLVSDIKKIRVYECLDNNILPITEREHNSSSVVDKGEVDYMILTM